MTNQPNKPSHQPDEPDNHKIQLGDEVKDVVTGLAGIAVARTEWLNGCSRITVQPQEIKDGKPADLQTIDEPQLVILQAGKVKTGPANPGGPIPTPQRHPSIPR